MLPLLILFIFGVFDLGRAFFSLITISNAAREGARFAMRFPNDPTGIQSAAVSEAANSGITINTGDIQITCEDLVSPTGCDRGQPVRVTVSYQFELLMGWILPSPVQLSRYVEMLVP
ncbi:MAG: pilus assembly protein [Chloroflexota bacterium]|nr:MAG: pilus assembly protein [Chloroflexota bacterium]